MNTEVGLQDFLDQLIEQKAHSLKTNTLRNYKQTCGYLIRHFGANKPVGSIAVGDADEWQDSMFESLSPATTSRETRRAQQFFKAAHRKGLITTNPFSDLKSPPQVNKSREFYVTTEAVEKVLEHCPDAEWKLIVSLCRHGGLRCPSEHLRLTWDCVDWDKDRITVYSPKTEHHVGGELRIIPMFSELRPHLERVFEEAEEGTKYVINRRRIPSQKYTTRLKKIITRAGLKPWPKLFQNMRATRQTELSAQFPLHVVCAWLGNSAPIAQKHYLQVTEQHFAEAIGGGAKSGALSAKRGAQNQAQHSAASSRNHPLKTKTARKNRAVLPIGAICSELLQTHLVPRRGVEPLSPP